MAQFQSSARPPLYPYNSAGVYTNAYTNTPTNNNYSHYPSCESSSSAFMRNQAASSSSTQLHLLSDLPDLYYDHDLPSPPSASSSNIICTPPLEDEWQMPWQETNSNAKCEIENIPPYLPSWDASPLAVAQAPHPAVGPIDPGFYWMYPQTGAEKPESLLFATYDAFGPMPPFDPHCTSYSQEVCNTHSMTNFAFAQPSSSSSTAPTVSPISDTISPSASYSSPATCQVPLKLYQPRPSRRIPIISLSKLASACDTYPIYSPPQEPTNGNSEEVKPATLGLSSCSSKSYPPITSHRSNDHSNFNRRHLHSTHGIYDNSFSVGINSGSGQMAQCPCGCMESYI